MTARKANPKKSAPRRQAPKQRAYAFDVKLYTEPGVGGIATDEGGRPVMDEGGRPLRKEDQ